MGCPSGERQPAPEQARLERYYSTVFRVNRAAMGREDLEIAQEKDWAQVGE